MGNQIDNNEINCNSISNSNMTDVVLSPDGPVKRAVIIGANPAGLVLAYELLMRTGVIPIILEESDVMGGVFGSIDFKGNQIDLGVGSPLFKSEEVIKWWTDAICNSGKYNGGAKRYVDSNEEHESLSKGKLSSECQPEYVENVWIDGILLPLPIPFALQVIMKFGILKAFSILGSYLKYRLFPRKKVGNLEDLSSNQFGLAFHKEFVDRYVTSICGASSRELSVKVGSEIIEEIVKCRKVKVRPTTNAKLSENDRNVFFDNIISNTSRSYLSDRHGSLWEDISLLIVKLGGEVRRNCIVRKICTEMGNSIGAISTVDCDTGEIDLVKGDYFFSTVTKSEFVASMEHEKVPVDDKDMLGDCERNQLITVGIVLKQLSFMHKKTGEWMPLTIKAPCIYILSKRVRVRRVKIYNNWKAFRVVDPDTFVVGMDFFCSSNDELLKLSDCDLGKMAMMELEIVGIACSANVLDITVNRVKYSNSFGFDDKKLVGTVGEHVDSFENLDFIDAPMIHSRSLDNTISRAIAFADDLSVKHPLEKDILNEDQQKYGGIDEINSRSDIAYKARSKVTSLEDSHLYDMSLSEFIFRYPPNRWFVLIGIPVLIIQFIIFKYFYPFAGFINGDSYVYLETAYHNLNMNTYPIGYSKLLRLISVFTHSDTFVVAFQYLLLQVSTMSFVFTIFYFYKPTRPTKILLFTCMLMNPVYLYLANYISSDSFFLSLSLIWFSLIFWIMNRPTNKLIVINALVLFLAFTVRYNALFYPAISLVALLLAKRKVYMNVLGFGMSLLLIAAFIHFTSNRYKELTGHYQFTPFTGWQLANNALYAYRYVDSANRKAVPNDLRQLDNMVRNYFDTSRDVNTHPVEALVASTVYMWDPRSPLTKYMEGEFKKDSTATALKKWATVAPKMNEYGSFLIKSYPKEFAGFYLIPNAIKYYTPPVEFLDHYSTGVDSVTLIAKVWFDYKSTKLRTNLKDFKVNVLDFYPVFTGTMNVIFVLCTMSFLFLNGYRQYPQLRRGLVLVVTFWGVNFGFSVFASPIALRFQLFPILVSFAFTFLLVEFLVQAARGIVREDERRLHEVDKEDRPMAQEYRSKMQEIKNVL